MATGQIIENAESVIRLTIVVSVPNTNYWNAEWLSCVTSSPMYCKY